MNESYRQAFELAEKIFRQEKMLFAPESEWQELVKSLRLSNLTEWVSDQNGKAVKSKKYPGSFPRPAMTIPEKNFSRLSEIDAKVPKRTAYRNRMLAYVVWEIDDKFEISATANPGASDEEKAKTASGIVADAYNRVRKELNPTLAPVTYNTARQTFSNFSFLRPVSKK